jgi:hypothetical protein
MRYDAWREHWGRKGVEMPKWMTPVIMFGSHCHKCPYGEENKRVEWMRRQVRYAIERVENGA